MGGWRAARMDLRRALTAGRCSVDLEGIPSFSLSAQPQVPTDSPSHLCPVLGGGVKFQVTRRSLTLREQKFASLAHCLFVVRVVARGVVTVTMAPPGGGTLHAHYEPRTVGVPSPMLPSNPDHSSHGHATPRVQEVRNWQRELRGGAARLSSPLCPFPNVKPGAGSGFAHNGIPARKERWPMARSRYRDAPPSSKAVSEESAPMKIVIWKGSVPHHDLSGTGIHVRPSPSPSPPHSRPATRGCHLAWMRRKDDAPHAASLSEASSPRTATLSSGSRRTQTRLPPRKLASSTTPIIERGGDLLSLFAAADGSTCPPQPPTTPRRPHTAAGTERRSHPAPREQQQAHVQFGMAPLRAHRPAWPYWA